MTLRRPHLIPVAMFFSTFAWSFVYVSLPFHIQAMSTGDAATTLRWTGWILGISPLITVAMSPVWGHFAERGDPRVQYVGGEVVQGFGFFAMALARTLAIGVINSARIGAAFMGPVLATMVLAWTSPPGLYVILAAVGLACVPLFASGALAGRAG